MSYAIGERRRTAKRDWKRKCDLCATSILAGDIVETYITKDGGDFYAGIEHAICRHIGLEHSARNGYPDYEWPMLADIDDDPANPALETALERLRLARCGV